MSKLIRRPDAIYAGIALLCITANIIAFFFQFFYNDLPCPLCLLQRFGFISIGLGATLSITNTPSWKYDILIITSSVFTLIVGLSQLFVNIVPNNSAYGNPFLGYIFIHGLQ